jgi:hypothetical protein
MGERQKNALRQRKAGFQRVAALWPPEASLP